MIMQVHSSHHGIERCVKKTKDILFWQASKCETCNAYLTDQQKEPLIPHDPHKRAWSHVARDLFSFDNNEWIIIVDHWSDY